MIRLDQIDKFNLSKINLQSLIKFKDYSTYYDYSSGNYYTSSTKFLNKMYKSKGLFGLKFIRDLSVLDSSYANNLINNENPSTTEDIYYDDKSNKFYYLNNDSYKNYTEILDLLYNENFSTIYKNTYEFREYDDYLLLNENNRGSFIQLSLLDDTIDFSDVEVSDGMISICKNSRYLLYDKDLINFTKLYLSNYSSISSSLYYKNYLNNKLTWLEICELLRKLKLKELLTDEDNECLCNLSWASKVSTYSTYEVKDALEIINSNIDRINLSSVMYFYNDLLENKLTSF